MVVFTDHKACTSLLTSTHLNKRLMRLALKLQGMALDIQYRPGKENGNADGLSRQGWEDDVPVEPRPGVCQTHPIGGPVGPDLHWKDEDQDKTEQIDSQFFFMYIDVCYLWFHVV